MSNDNITNSIFNTKTITSAGGIVLALVLSYYIYKITANHLDHIDKAIQNQTEVQRETNSVLRDQTRVLESLKTVIEQKR